MAFATRRAKLCSGRRERCGRCRKLQDGCKPSAGLRILMRNWLLAFLICAVSIAVTHAQEDKKADDLKPADPDTGESTVEEATLGLLPNPFEKQGVKFAITYIGEGMGNPNGGEKRGAVCKRR